MFALHKLQIHTPDLILRLPTEQEVSELAQRACGQILAPSQAHWMGQWTQISTPRFEEQFYQHHMLQRGQFSPEQWNLNLFAFLDERSIGSITLRSTMFTQSKCAGTGSWLLQEQQGRGLGTQMRAGVLTLAFEYLQAERARTTHHRENIASQRVSQKLGYQRDGSEEQLLDGKMTLVERWLLPKERWEKRQGYQVDGFAEAQHLFVAADAVDLRRADSAR